MSGAGLNDTGKVARRGVASEDPRVCACVCVDMTWCVAGTARAIFNFAYRNISK